MINKTVSKKINFFCLLAAIILVLVLPFRKEIWYDESISILISKGFSHDTPGLFANTDTLNSAALENLNTPANVFTATVIDNSNSFLYNICLHWFTWIFGNSIPVYMWLSKLCGIGALIGFFVLCNLFFENTLFVGFAIVLLALDNIFTGMSHEIRAYEMAACFVIIAAVYFYKFLYQKEKPLYLLITGLCAAGAILSHFLSVYIILVFLIVIVFTKKTALLSAKNVFAMLIPVGLLAIFFYCSYTGLQNMNKQNEAIQERVVVHGFSVWAVFLKSLKFTAINFKIVFPAFREVAFVILASSLLIGALYAAAIKFAVRNEEKRNLHILFALGFSGSLFLGLLSVKAQHYTSLYNRYYTFCVPFCVLFTAYALFVLNKSDKINRLVKAGSIVIVFFPTLVLFVSGFKKREMAVDYKHIAIARQIVKNNVTTYEVKQWSDALLLHAVLPNGYKINYLRNPGAPVLSRPIFFPQ